MSTRYVDSQPSPSIKLQMMWCGQLVELAESGFNRTSIITLRDGQQLVARIPHPVTVPKYYAVASEVATIECLRSSGLPGRERRAARVWQRGIATRAVRG